MRIESSFSYQIKNNNITPPKNITYNSNTKNNNINFCANLNKPSKGLLEKFSEILTSPIKLIKNKLKKLELEAKLKKEAEEAAEKAKQAEYEARVAAKEAEKLKLTKETAKQVLEYWQTRHKGQFQDRICTDKTGDIIMLPEAHTYSGTTIADAPQKGEYTLANCGVCDIYGASQPGAGNIMLRDANNNIATPLKNTNDTYSPEYRDHR